MERMAPSGGLHGNYVAGALTVDKPFQNHPELSGGGRKAELHPNSCRDLDAKYVENIPYASQT